MEEKRSDIMSKIAAMLVERKNNLAHFINNLEDSEEPEFYVDQWERLKEMESHMLTVGPRLSWICCSYQGSWASSQGLGCLHKPI